MFVKTITGMNTSTPDRVRTSGSMFSMLGASAFLAFLPMLPVQILVNNMLYDFSQTSVATDNVDEDYGKAPLQWDTGMVRTGPNEKSAPHCYSQPRPILFVVSGVRYTKWNH